MAQRPSPVLFTLSVQLVTPAFLDGVDPLNVDLHKIGSLAIPLENCDSDYSLPGVSPLTQH